MGIIKMEQDCLFGVESLNSQTEEREITFFPCSFSSPRSRISARNELFTFLTTNGTNFISSIKFNGEGYGLVTSQSGEMRIILHPDCGNRSGRMKRYEERIVEDLALK